MPKDGRLDTRWVTGVRGVSILRLFKEAGVGAVAVPGSVAREEARGEFVGARMETAKKNNG